MSIRRFFLLLLVPAALLFQGCPPKDVVNPITPPSPVNNDEPGDDKPGDDKPAAGIAMTVCTFNIRYANTTDTYPDGSSAAWSARQDAVKKFINTTRPDLIGLQEIRKEQSQWFATMSSDYGYYDVSRDSSNGSSVSSAGGEGVGVMYLKDRFELVVKDFFWLDTKTRERPVQNSDNTYGDWHSACRRVTVYVALKDKKNNGAMVYFFPSHYDHKSDEARKNAAELMVKQMKALCKESNLKDASSVIIHLGDLNTQYENAALAPLNSEMYYARLAVDGSDKYTGTFNSFGDKSSLIDHIYYGGRKVKPLKYWVDRSNYGVPFLSDHYPVLFQWEYK